MQQNQRFHSLDAVRALALLAGIFLHATMSFWPGMREVRWPISDDVTSPVPYGAFFVLHIFRMSLFFALAGFFARLLFGKLGTWGFVKNRLRRIALPMAAAMLVVMPLLIVPFVLGVRELGISGPPLMPPPIPNPRMPPWGHLWFLYLLLVLYVLWLALRAAVGSIDRRGVSATVAGRVLRALVASRLAPLALAAPTACVLYFAPWWQMWGGIPAPIMGLVPNFPAVLAYGSAFAFGWFVHRDPALPALVKRDWLPNLVIAVALSAVALWMIGARPQFSVMTLPQTQRLMYAIAYNAATWFWLFGVTGAALRFLDAPSARWRYLADSAFFVYLVHLPIVYLLQVWMMRWPVHWALKYALVVLLTFAIVMPIYHYLVRSTFVGRFLNGRKYPRGAAATVTSARSSSPG